MSDQKMSDQKESELKKPDQKKSDQKKPDQKKTEQKKSDQRKTDQKKSGRMNPDQRRQTLRARRRRKVWMIRGVLLLVALVGIALAVWGISSAVKEGRKLNAGQGSGSSAESQLENLSEPETQAKLLAAQYDYDGAIAVLEAVEDTDRKKEIQSLIDQYQEEKGELVAMGADSVRHFSFPILLVEDQATTEEGSPLTLSQFQQILQELYDNNYVLVDIYDLVTAHDQGSESTQGSASAQTTSAQESTSAQGDESTQESGSQTYEKGTIYLPEGKKPFVLSQRDVSYPFDKAGNGYASRLVVDADGSLANEYVQADKTTVTGDYDVVSCLETFLEEHPDFSYHGARGTLGLTGYNGILGYRTTSYLASTEGNPYADYGTYDTQSEIAACQTVVQALKDKGWNLASNGNGNTSYGSEMSQMQADADLWQTNVASVVGSTDILIFPYETDIDGWSGYSQDNEKYSYLWNQGFRYFCIEDGENVSWLQVGQTYVRQGIHEIDSYQDYQTVMALEQ